MIKEAIDIPTIYKQFVMIVFDSIAIVAVILASFSLRLGLWFWPQNDLFVVVFCSPIIAIPVFIKFGLYQSIIRFLGFHALWDIVKAVSLYALIWGIVGFMSFVEYIPRSVILINCMLAIILIGGSRMLARWLLSEYIGHDINHSNNNVIIYGAGSAGRQLSNALSQSSEFTPVAFIDDSSELNKRLINGIKVHNSKDIDLLIDIYGVSEILLAMPSASRKRRHEIIDSLEIFPVKVRILPGMSAIAQGKIKVNDLRELNIEDLLGRSTVMANQKLLDRNIKDKVVMVTGAGGSIGSELCRQISLLGASKLIMYERSELALYTVNRELGEVNVNTDVTCILGSVTNRHRLEAICKKFSVQTIYHAAAYKHVPMVELNNTEGVQNNIFGTLSCAKAAINCKVETFVLISTDKAVRPTNTMGATKRTAEMILQALSKEQNSTKFCMVRFGNVLGSSGSVIPLFKDQIAQGGPITVTDINIIRYFMTISESVELVIQAGAMGDDGDVFVLDMGEPININDLAHKMVNLSGLHIKNSDNPNGDIEIKYTGLRSGEKLYEELLIGDNTFETENPMILRAKEDMLSWKELKPILNELELSVKELDNKKLRKLLIKAVPAFKPQSDISDLLYN